MTLQRPRKPAAGSVRIIGGHWRGRRLRFPDRAGLRPTGDRLRETLFNWLQPHCAGARCLDLYAGSGALGFEAASRGAARVTLVERDAVTAAALRANQAALDTGQAKLEIVEAEALAWLESAPQTQDIVFLDPPFAAAALAPVFAALETRGWLGAGSWIYVEAAREQAVPAAPETWSRYREMTAGAVHCLLFRRI
ncbi:MAG: 16S rRNA (guanine(966)-N(2))-methyltransferase RsmD [Porticoccaceae bacterium]|nr:16S rRNA (guanine(966)-N(2))-methyltransferase RsmD [Porticoccaceae bacterium]